MTGPKHPWVEMVFSCVFFQFVGELFRVILVDFMASVGKGAAAAAAARAAAVVAKVWCEKRIPSKNQKLEVTNSLENSNKITFHSACCCCVFSSSFREFEQF